MADGDLVDSGVRRDRNAREVGEPELEVGGVQTVGAAPVAPYVPNMTVPGLTVTDPETGEATVVNGLVIVDKLIGNELIGKYIRTAESGSGRVEMNPDGNGSIVFFDPSGNYIGAIEGDFSGASALTEVHGRYVRLRSDDPETEEAALLLGGSAAQLSVTAADMSQADVTVTSDWVSLHGDVLISGTNIMPAGTDYDTGWITDGVTAATNFSIVAQKYRRVGKMVYLCVKVKRTTSDLVLGTYGDVANTALCTMPTGFRPTDATLSQGLCAGEGGRVASYSIGTSGVIYLCATVPDYLQHQHTYTASPTNIGNVSSVNPKLFVDHELTICGSYLLD